MIDALLARFTYLGFAVLVGIGLFVLIDEDNLVKKVIGLNVFQTGVLLFLVSSGYLTGGVPPIVEPGGGPYANPLPQVLVLTAIVVGVSVTALALALVVRIHREYGSLREDVIRAQLDEEPHPANGGERPDE